MISFSNGPMFSANKGCDQPPKRKPLDGSSSGPPGACITQSSDWKTAPVSLRIGGNAFDRGLDLGDVDLAHGHHRPERALPALARGSGQLEQAPGRDLPRIAPFVLAPPAHAFLA